ncbi:hypothetical protein LBMAG53_15000 [Planctomycetota bacterium]|nr:hypothetical protein LBMAG53_15000 [Planctomycetota bacterium]
MGCQGKKHGATKDGHSNYDDAFLYEPKNKQNRNYRLARHRGKVPEYARQILRGFTAMIVHIRYAHVEVLGPRCEKNVSEN